ncbi:MAG: hypothetical protein A3J46_06180 [Candidatus Yanofskybacteria bacterium RIFCSPHIGHO2_02_FULL_41_11]|uniref:Uncharacterized protein n=1 Tax=Candidatus Yanofskybacteria bacterium RIFCSPHIGHO2_02_FULL_41_11 TaxID=1802675 RepID=A0A1F8F7H9_9BACT|nr:MAG: hypothetical protein A3J46_06180 [Candidatus Yanofskybacteria bacterium RIFCSPHIGHO2_02_FULL_41_11]
MSDKKRLDSTEKAQQRSDRIKEVPVSEEILKETAAYILANPPKFPLLKGKEEEQICRRIKDLMKTGDIVWNRHHPTIGGDNYTAEYKNLILEITTTGYPWFEKKLVIKGSSIIHDRVFESRNSDTPFYKLFKLVEEQFDKRTKISRPIKEVEVVDDHITIWNILNL